MTDKTADPEAAALLTLDEFLRTAADRGKRLWGHNTRKNVITDGSKRYKLPQDLPGGRLPWRAVQAMCALFELKAVDFALDPPPDD